MIKSWNGLVGLGFRGVKWWRRFGMVRREIMENWFLSVKEMVKYLVLKIIKMVKSKLYKNILEKLENDQAVT